MNKIYFSFLLLIFTALGLSAQVGDFGIGTNEPHPSSALDVVSESKGILIPRMAKVTKENISNAAEGLMVYDTDLKCVSIYKGQTFGWSCLTSTVDSFFYMPSINIDTSVKDNNLELDLYAQYESQFGAPKNTSPDAVALEVFTRNQLYYYVTYYDPNIIEINSISDTGVMNYNVIGHANYDTYMNVIFVVR